MQRNMHRVSIFLNMAALTAFLFGCKPSPSPAPTGSAGLQTPTAEVRSGTVNIFLQENMFLPPKLTVKAGTMVTWINRDPAFHTVYSDTKLFQSNMLGIGQTFSYTFNDPGTYPYYSDDHGGPGGTGMSGVITVVP